MGYYSDRISPGLAKVMEMASGNGNLSFSATPKKGIKYESYKDYTVICTLAMLYTVPDQKIIPLFLGGRNDSHVMACLLMLFKRTVS